MRIVWIVFACVVNFSRKPKKNFPTMSDQPRLKSGSIGQFGGRVGHKAAGFISKKFFHPSNYKNQEKLWAAIEAKKEQEKRQEELLKKREEERRIETLMGEMKSSQASVQLIASSSSGLLSSEVGVSQAEKDSMAETRKRLAILRESDNTNQPQIKLAVQSRYPEDILEKGHTEVWGSFFDLKLKK
jgi:hypothetical protein